MPRTRKFGESRRIHRRKTLHRRRNMKGGGKLVRLPMGSQARNDDGNPSVTRTTSGAEYIVGTPEALDFGRSTFQQRIARSVNPPAGLDPRHFPATLKKLHTNALYTYFPLNSYESTYNSVYDKTPEEIRKTLTDEHVKKSREAIRNEVSADFLLNWDFKYLCGHGIVAPRLPPVRVPARTYIRFHSPAGSKAVVSSDTGYAPILAHPDVFVPMVEDRDEQLVAFTDLMTNHYFANTGPLQSFSSVAERADILSVPYMNDFHTAGRMAETTLRLGTGGYREAERYQTIYAPGEIMNEMYITFANNPYQSLMLGLYELPIPYDFFDIFTHASTALRAEGATKDLRNPAEIAAALRKQQEEDNQYLAADSVSIIDHDGTEKIAINPNLFKRMIGYRLTLAQIFEILERDFPVPDGKVRFLYINSCRGVPKTTRDMGVNVENIVRAWNGDPAARGAGAGGPAAGGAGGPPAAVAPNENRPIAHFLRRNYIDRLRRASLGDPAAKNILIRLPDVIRAIQEQRTLRHDNPRHRELQAIIDSAPADVQAFAQTFA